MEELEMILLEGEERMDKAIKSYDYELATVRTGRASANILDTVTIDYYGVQTPIRQISTVTIPEANQLYIKPYEKNSVKAIEQALFASNLGLTPQNDGNGIRLIFPKMTEERRRELVKSVGKMEETAKVQIRNIRRDLNEEIKKLELPEDAEKESLDDIQKLTDKKIAQIEERTEKKSKDLMTI